MHGSVHVQLLVAYYLYSVLNHTATLYTYALQLLCIYIIRLLTINNASILPLE